MKKKTNFEKYYFKNARTAFGMSIKLLNLDKKDKILLPAYIGYSEKEGSGVYDPVQKSGIGYLFYSLLKDLSVDKKDFVNKIKQRNVKAVLVIHYFGFYQPGFDFIVKTCKKYKKYLIEDCAHAFNSEYKGKKLGTFGDFAFFSIHKFLSIRSGGILNVNRNVKPIKPRYSINEDISRSAKNTFILSNIEKISKIRRENYLYVLKKVKNLKGLIPLYPQLPLGIVPHDFPVIIKSNIRNEIFFYLRKRKIGVSSLYYMLISQINRKHYPVSYFLSDHIFNLPIHQTMTKEKINYMIEILSKALEKNETKIL